MITGTGRGSTRAEFLRTAAGGAAGMFLAGAGSLASELVQAGPAAGATLSTSAGSGAQLFHSRPDLRPPKIQIVHRAQETADGYVFITPLSGPGQRGVQMLDDRRSSLVWFRPTDAADGAELPRRALQGRARTHLVGRQVADGPRHRCLRDRRPVVSRDRARSRQGVGNRRICTSS